MPNLRSLRSRDLSPSPVEGDSQPISDQESGKVDDDAAEGGAAGNEEVDEEDEEQEVEESDEDEDDEDDEDGPVEGDLHGSSEVDSTSDEEEVDGDQSNSDPEEEAAETDSSAQHDIERLSKLAEIGEDTQTVKQLLNKAVNLQQKIERTQRDLVPIVDLTEADGEIADGIDMSGESEAAVEPEAADEAGETGANEDGDEVEEVTEVSTSRRAATVDDSEDSGPELSTLEPTTWHNKKRKEHEDYQAW